MPIGFAREARVSPYLFLTLTPLFWACNAIIGRALHDAVPPMGMTFFRWLFAVAILAPFAWPHLRRDWPTVRERWRVLAVLGAIGIGSHNGLAYLGLNHTSATNVVILNSFVPIMIIAMAWLLFRQRLGGAQAAGVAISLGGVLAILSRGSLEALLGLRLNIGDVLVILSMAMWSLYTVLLRWRPPGLHMLSFLFVLAVVGDLVMLPLWLGEMALGRFIAWSPTVLGALLFVATFASVLAYIFWNRAVEIVGPAVAGLFVHLMPVFGSILAWVFLDERIEVYHVAGIVLILAGIAITSRRGRAGAPAGTD